MIEVRFENGSSIWLSQEVTMATAAVEAHEALLGCLPKGVTPEKLVRVTVVRQTHSCALCGVIKPSRSIEMLAGHSVSLCESCMRLIAAAARRDVIA